MALSAVLGRVGTLLLLQNLAVSGQMWHLGDAREQTH